MPCSGETSSCHQHGKKSPTKLLFNHFYYYTTEGKILQPKRGQIQQPKQFLEISIIHARSRSSRRACGAGGAILLPLPA